MKAKYNEENIETLLKSLKHNEVMPESSFTANVMQRIKDDSSFDDDIINLDKVDDMLEGLAFADSVKPSDNFTLNVMEKIKAESSIKYDEKNVESVLNLLSKQPVTLPKSDFTDKVMAKINEADSEENIISFEKVYKKFLIGGVIAAAAAVILALNLFSSYDPAMAEFMVTDYFNAGLY